ncbi:MAG: redox-regulated ATPase YchF [Deinococcus sp.]|nr:redox-regulated ATPase YchF [Deinococcus sp.]
MKAGLVGFPQVGKTTIFNLLTGARAETSRYSSSHDKFNVGVARVPDARLDYLAQQYQRRKTTYATVEYLDIPGVKHGEAKAEAQLAQVRQADTLVQVVRAFRDDEIIHAYETLDPKRDVAAFEVELILSDLVQVDTRLRRLEKELKVKRSPELEHEQVVLELARAHLEKERPLRELELSEDQRTRIRGFGFLSEKPILTVVNLGEEDLERLEQVAQDYRLDFVQTRPQSRLTAVCGKIEQEISQLSREDAQAFIVDLGLKEFALDRLIHATYELLGLISFFTIGEDELRAWTIRRGTKAHQAAGAVHSDMERGFIRAEVVANDDYVRYGGMAGAREKGHFRLEGKEYLVQDGDIIHYRFNVS